MSGRRLIGTLMPIETAEFSAVVHVRVDGPPAGAPLVLLHGFSGSMRWWDRVAPLLRNTFRLVRVDLLGHGFTTGPALDSPGQATMVDAVLAKLSIAGATVVGHSFGADVAVELAERSNRIDQLMIICQAPDYGDAMLPSGKTIMTLPALSAPLHRVAAPLGTLLSRVGGIMRGYPIGPELARLGLLDFGAMDSGMFRVILIDRRDRMAARPLDVQVRDTAKPTLVLAGARDHFYGARYAERYRVAGARVEIFGESGHSPIVEQPGRTARLIREFALGKDTPA